MAEVSRSGKSYAPPPVPDHGPERPHIGPPTKSGDHFTKTNRTSLEGNAAGSARPDKTVPIPQPDHGPKSGAARQPSPGSKPGAVQRVGNGVLSAGSSFAKPKSGDGTGAVMAIFAVIGLVVGLAMARGNTTINKGAALVAWFILFFLCTVLAKLNKGIGVGLAVLLLIQALLEFGPAAFTGLGAGPGTTSTSATSNQIQSGGTNLPEDATAAILGYLGLKAGTDFIGGAASGAGQVAGGAAAAGAAKAGTSIWQKLRNALGSGADDAATVAGDVGEGVVEAGTAGAE